MPIYSFSCNNCGKEDRLLVKSDEKVGCSHCGKEMDKIFNKCPNTKITEKRDEFKNKNVVSGMEQIARERSKNYFVDNCVDEAIAKVAENFGEKEAFRHAVKYGWVDKSTGKKIRKIDIK